MVLTTRPLYPSLNRLFLAGVVFGSRNSGLRLREVLVGGTAIEGVGHW